MDEIKTITLDNFRGRLVKDIYGELNSGNTCPIAAYSGANPFWTVYRNGGCQFMPTNTQVGTGSVTSPIAWYANHVESGTLFTYGVSLSGEVFQTQVNNGQPNNPDIDTVTKFTNGAGDTLNYGGGMTLSKLDGTDRIFIGTDSKVQYSNNYTPGSATFSSAGTPANSNVPRPLVYFQGKIYAADGNNIDSVSGTLGFSSALLSPTIPKDYIIRDLTVSDDGRYLVMIATQQPGINFASGIPPSFYAQNSMIVVWNGTDASYTSAKVLAGVNLTSVETSGDTMIIFGEDDEGMAIFDSNGNKINQVFDYINSAGCNAPFPGAVFAVGSKFFFLTQQGFSFFLYVYDSTENSLYALWSTSVTNMLISGGLIIPSFHAQSSTSGQDLTRSKIYLSGSKSATFSGTNSFMHRIHLQQYTGDNTFAGNYSTQVQRFEKKIQIDEIRVFHANPGTAANAAYTINIIGGNGAAFTNGAYSYTYASGTDPTKGQGALDMVKFKPALRPISEMGININNTGTGQIIISKIEIDYHYISNPENS